MRDLTRFTIAVIWFLQWIDKIMRYKCRICGFETDLKSQINFHHITPKECGREEFEMEFG